MGVFGYVVVGFLVLLFIGAFTKQEEEKKIQDKYKQFNRNRVPKRTSSVELVDDYTDLLDDNYDIDQKKAFRKYKKIPLYIKIEQGVKYPQSLIRFGDKAMTFEQMRKNGLDVQLIDENIKENYRYWGSTNFSCFNEENCGYFDIEEADLTNPIHQESLKTGKYLTEDLWLIKELSELGVPLTEFVIYGKDLEYFIKAVDYFRTQDWKNAKKEIDMALSYKWNEEYDKMKIKTELALNNSTVAEEEINKLLSEEYVFGSSLLELIQVFAFNKQYHKILEYVKKANVLLIGVDKVYFNQDLLNLFTSTDIPNDRETIELFDIIYHYSNKTDFRVLERIADQYSAWGMNDKANELYQKCITLLENKKHPRIKSRIEKKITE